MEQSFFSLKISSTSFSVAVRDKSEPVTSKPGSIPVYKLPLDEKEINIKGCRYFSFGKASSKPNRTIMVLGATGAGKSTTINGMINYILGVQWEDDYRFKLVHEDQSKSQVESQTEKVTVYKLYHQKGFNIDYSLTIIDTPGFGDTRGIKRDKEITEHVRNLFSSQSGVSTIDAVCFVAQATLARLTPTQQYVFDSILSIFGKDIAENIRILVTFADSEKLPVLEAIRASGVPCPKGDEGLPVHFKFNNSALFADNKKTGSSPFFRFNMMFWEIGTDSMRFFFSALNNMETKSLIMTNEVLRERQQLEVSIENLQKQIKLSLSQMEHIRASTKVIQDHEAEISRNEKFEFYVDIKKPVQKDISRTGNYITNCQVCHMTCHYPCALRNDKDKRRCKAMGRNGNCKQCPGKCHWTKHFNQKYRWSYKTVREKRTMVELKLKYQKATGEKMTVQGVLNQMMNEYKIMEQNMVRLIKESADCLNKLKKIALKPNPLSIVEYINLLIEGEKREAKPGWMERVDSLMKMKQNKELMAKVEKGENLLVQ